MNIKVGFHYGAEDRFVDESESEIMAVQHFEIGDHWISADVAKIYNDGPFLTLALDRTFEEDYPYIRRSVDTVNLLYSELTPDDWLEGTTDEVLLLPVSSIEWVNLAVLA